MAKSLLSLLISTSLLSSSLAHEPDTGLNDCYISDQAYSGDVIMNLTAGCSRECQRKCEANAECMFWTYSADSLGLHDCILYSSGTPVPLLGKISGPKRCSEPYHCIHKNLEVGTASLKVVNAQKEHDCHRECALLATCLFANWTTDGKCHLKGANAVQDNKYGMAHSTAMPRDCSDGWCYQKGSLECSDVIETVNEIPNARKCQEACRLKDGCDIWSWNKNGGKACRLMRMNCYIRANIERDDNAFIGPKRCGTPSSCHEHFNYREGDIRFVSAENAEECNDLCFQDSRCEYFTFGIAKKRCWMKTAASLIKRVESSGFISGPAICHGKPRCIEFDVDYVGGDIRTVGQVPDEFNCINECKSARGCNLVTYIPDTYECVLKKGIRGTTRTMVRGRISIPLECYFSASY